jgi:hypothetical protein
MSEPGNGDLQTSVALLQAELGRLREASAGAWAGYLTWFTWFHTTQIGLLGWVVLRNDGVSRPEMVVALAVILILFNVLGMRAGVHQDSFGELQRRRAEDVCRSLSACAERSGVAIEITSGFAHGVVHAAVRVFTMASSVAVVGWLYVIFRYAWPR